MPALSISGTALLLAIAAAIYRFLIHPLFISPLSKIPSAHWSAPFSPLWILLIRYRRRENRTLHAAHQKLGAVIRVAPNELSVNDLNGVRTVYGGGFEKGEWYGIFDNYGVPCMFSTALSPTHSARKRMVSNTYSKSTIHASASIHSQADHIIFQRLLPVLANSFPNPVEIHEIWNATTMDFITSYLFGLASSSKFLLRPEERKHWLHLYHGRKTYPYFSQELPNLTRWCKRVGVRLVPKWVDEANNELEAWCQARCEAATKYLELTPVDERKPEDEPVVMTAMLKGISKEERVKGESSVLADTTLRHPELSLASEMIDHLAAGFETSGIALTYISYYLSLYPKTQEALRAELKTLDCSFQIDKPDERKLPDFKELDRLPLLSAIVMETLRLRASIPGNQPRMTPYPSCTIGTYDNIPGGVRIGSQAHSVHRNPEVFEDPELWKPERWMDGEEEPGDDEEKQLGKRQGRRKEMDRWFWAFSSGGRMCVGSHFAIHEIKLVIAAVYINFRTIIVDDTGIEQEDGYTCGPTSNQLTLRLERV